MACSKHRPAHRRSSMPARTLKGAVVGHYQGPSRGDTIPNSIRLDGRAGEPVLSRATSARRCRSSILPSSASRRACASSTSSCWIWVPRGSGRGLVSSSSELRVKFVPDSLPATPSPCPCNNGGSIVLSECWGCVRPDRRGMNDCSELSVSEFSDRVGCGEYEKVVAGKEKSPNTSVETGDDGLGERG